MLRDSGLITHIPSSIPEMYGIMALGIDVMYINKRLFILSVSKYIKYFQCMGTRNKTIKTFMNTIGKMKADYQLQEFKVKILCTD